ncbi:MAG: glycosyltransferase [Chlorobium sp.]|jgi:glycosyltransferase involved in cell wall biosynthesis|uniref:glycosyltransferase n=1 Tax=Chlorobium sp. TaxID=1095 RepID=UPI0025C72B13|nr:glycosyltransferase [Chlorobium sp.]MCF8216973.1 glycosyltransferase [Chlorobium sp.]MCF8271803.1 glycosyltransferase [Chlorobium sp.]MCF8288190.1 glycosyltransferase [Chlorobium sp.]MCF8291553.1 glycosyltransferase [Chlorobium sp.]MCF8385873.1 glycosyltransferase [Chlorobium sp.]
MNILFLNSTRRGWGGNEKWTMLAAQTLARDYNTFLAYREPNIADRFTIEKFRLPFIAEIDPVTIVRLIGIIRKRRIDVLVPTKRKDYVLAGIVSRICSTANIVRLGIDRPLKDTFWNKLVYGTLADGIIVNSSKIRETLTKSSWIKPEKIRVIYNGLDCHKLETLSKEPFLKPAPFLIASAGLLIARKGFEMLIHAFALFLKEVPDAQAALVIAGDGPQHATLQQLAETLNIQNNVHLTGFLDNPYPLYRNCDVFVSASSSEGISNALIEAMYLNCVPISTPSGGIEEIMRDGENGFLVAHADKKKLAALIDELYHNPNRRQCIGAAAHETVLQAFSLDRMKKELLDFIVETTRKKQCR